MKSFTRQEYDVLLEKQLRTEFANHNIDPSTLQMISCDFGVPVDGNDVVTIDLTYDNNYTQTRSS